MNRLLSAFLLLTFASVYFQACTDLKSEPQQATVVKEEKKDWEMDASLANYLSDFERDFENGLNEKRIPGAAVVIVKDGRVVFQKGFGVKEKGKAEPVNEHTVFRLGSVSKGFASVLAGVFVEEGVVSWDEPVNRYLNEFQLNDAEQTGRVQVKHLLSHTTGLPRHAYTNLVEDGLPLERIIPRLKQVPLIAKEGEQIAYQNATYSVIEKVLESQTDTSFNALLHDKLFTPLNMTYSSAAFDSIRYSPNKASPHVYHSRSKGRVPIPISRKYYNAVSSGGINASASDMGQWLLLLTGHYPDIISKETLDTIYEPLATINNRRFSRHWEGVNRSHYGMGWRILDNHGQKVVYHGGYVNGYRSEIAFAPDEGLGICVLINSNSSYPLTVIPDLFEQFRAGTDEEPKSEDRGPE
ncbi:serine hydrolase domain-containing protein [Gracilimonas amylolytica]|uniref:serine hydrolase domain-containing protein n=1 Tax=Gracilimonas amylolytica TaxID=1749045 RepID=UPI000CD7F163|nr:serine hydrolase domain-containing protein [Gracilimonas amylolytica]